MEDNKNIIESGIVGNGAVVFGGKVNAAIYSVELDTPNVVIGFRELDRVYKIGETPDEINRNKDTQIHLVFDKIESIDVVKSWLDMAKDRLLKELEQEGEVK